MGVDKIRENIITQNNTCRYVQTTDHDL